MKSFLFIALVIVSISAKAQAPKFGVFGGPPLYVNAIQEYTIQATASEPAKAHITWTYTENPSVSIIWFGVYRQTKTTRDPVSPELAQLTDLSINSADVPINKDTKQNVIVIMYFTDHGASYSNQLRIHL
jgi:hypothetical protein